MYNISTINTCFIGYLYKLDEPIKLYANVAAAARALKCEHQEILESRIEQRIKKAANGYRGGVFINCAYNYRWVFKSASKLSYVLEYLKKHPP